VDSAWEQEKPETRKMLAVGAAESPASSARCVRRVLGTQDSLAVKRRLRKSGENLGRGYDYTDNCCDNSKSLNFCDFVFQENNSQCYSHY
jgi:hypothetical protein